MGFDARAYNRTTMDSWDEVAPRYHKRWARMSGGPFRVAQTLIAEAGIKEGDHVLDMACGTGMGTVEIASKVGSNGSVVGMDISGVALHIAMRVSRAENIQYLQTDVETASLKRRFDAVVCQYALFFFPDANRALKNAHGMLGKTGTLAVSVHGTNVPFYRCILDVMPEFIPDHTPKGSPDLGRFSTHDMLYDEISDAGFSRVSVKKHLFEYSPGTFDEYWTGYLEYVPGALRRKIDGLGPAKNEFRDAVRERTAPYVMDGGRIVFPWEVLIAIAR